MPIFMPEQLADWTGGRWVGTPRPARGVAHDTRALAAGALYVALRGERFDGHRFIAQAFERGAAAALVEADALADAAGAAGPLLVVPDARRALAALARGHRARLAARFVGVTGSLGKTTVKEMLARLLRARGPTAASRGNWNNDIGLPLSLLRMEPGDAFGVFEIGMNHPGEIAPLAALLRPDWAVLTRVGPVHLEFFPDERAIASEKAALLDALGPSGVAVLAADEPWFELLRARAPGRVVTVGFAGTPDYLGQVPQGRRDALEVTERDGGRTVYPMPLPGEAIRRNALRAIAAGRELGLAPGDIAAQLRGYRPPPMRWDESESAGVRWINDAYNANPLSVRSAIETLGDLDVAGRRWLVLGGMHEIGAGAPERHREVGRLLAGGPWAGVATVGALAADIAAGALEAGYPGDRVARCGAAAEAAAWLAPRLAAGDAVLLKGSRRERLEDVLQAWEQLRGGAGAAAPAAERRTCCTT